MSTANPTTNIPAWPLTDEQRQIVELCRDFAAKEIRPRGRDVDEADTVTPVDIFAKAASVGITDFMWAMNQTALLSSSSTVSHPTATPLRASSSRHCAAKVVLPYPEGA